MMTDKEKAIIMAYTGVTTLVGDKLDIYYKYVAKLLGRPVYSHELANENVVDAIKRASFHDFKAICTEKRGEWIETKMHYKDALTEYDYWRCSKCLSISAGRYGKTPYCPHCGAQMRTDEEEDNGGTYSDNPACD